MKCPEKVQLSRADGEALRTRLAGDALTAADRRGVDQVLQWYFWLLFALQEATFSLKRLRGLLFGEKPNKRKTSPPGASSNAGGGPGGIGSGPAYAVADATQATDAGMSPPAGERRPGHGRQGAETYRGAEHVVCRHETFAAGERVPSTRCSSIAMPRAGGQAEGVVTSTKPRAEGQPLWVVEGSSAAGLEWWVTQRFFSVPQLTPIPLCHPRNR